MYNSDGTESFTANVEDSDIQDLAEQIMEMVMSEEIFHEDGQNSIQLNIEEQIKIFLHERAIPE